MSAILERATSSWREAQSRSDDIKSLTGSTSLMQFDFDTVIDRRGTDTMKWGRYDSRDIIPMWVADMDFASPPAVLEALHERVDHGVFGYADPDSSAVEAVVDMLQREHNWTVSPDWLIWTPGLVVALNLSCRMLDSTGDGVLTVTPIYPPFLYAPQFTERKLQTVELVEYNGRYEFDFEKFEASIEKHTRLFLLSNPQNPTGRVYSKRELEQLAEICLRHDLIVCSDEVHCGLILDDDKPHVSLAGLSPELAARTITLMAPSKTFNLAGMMCAFAVIPDTSLRRRFSKTARGIVTELNTFGYTACRAAYRECEAWRLALLDYLRESRKKVGTSVNNFPGIRMNHVEATYLAWLDCRELPMEDPAAHFKKAGVELSDGALFGTPGFVRLNFGCPRATLEEGLKRIRSSL